ncbi:MAG TPA: hypothetical protein VJP78_13385 [Thermoleophilia bacterium]|nr:hypothetical protein [Thermoleophilia bacterium]
MDIVFLILALVCFILEALSIQIGAVKLLPLGLAFWVVASLV